MKNIVFSFSKKVSKGSRFNQVYVPREMEKIIEVGDLVEVKLLKKHSEIYYKNLAKLSDFKEYLIKNIFSTLQKFNEIKFIFIVGSFLYETVDYGDIDAVLIADKEKENFEENINKLLTEKFNQRFHIILFSEEKLKTLIEKDPLTRAMFESYVCNKKIKLSYKRTFDKKHIKFLLMMPQDLLELTLQSKIFYDNLRRLISIEHFLENKSLNRRTILNEIKKILNPNILNKIKNNKEINKNEINSLREIIKTKIKNINRLMKNEQKR